MSVIDAPVRPAVEGTRPFSDEINATYTAGLDPSVAMLKKMLRRTTVLGCDIEGFGLGRDAQRIKCVTFATETDAVVLDPRDPAQARIIRFAFKHCTGLIFHNSPFDVPILCANKLMQPSDIAKVWDTLIYARFVHGDKKVKKGLLALCERYFGSDGTDQLMKAFKTLGLTKKEGFLKFDLDRPQYLMGAATDGIMTARLFRILRAEAVKRTTSGHPFARIGVTGAEAERLVDREQVINRMLLRRTVRGFKVDFDYLEQYKDRTSVEQDRAEAELSSYGIRPGVAPDLLKWLDARGEIPDGYPRTKTTDALSGVADHLETLTHPLALTFVHQKQTAKVLNDYLVKVRDEADSDGRIHPQMNVFGAAASGRMSMSDPPLQQFPGLARPILLAENRCGMSSIDWSQIEPVLAANLSGEVKMLAGYESGTSDVYTDLGVFSGQLPPGTTPDQCAEGPFKKIRGGLKTGFLAELYGTGLDELARQLKVTPAEAMAIKKHIARTMPEVTKRNQLLRQISKQHRKIITLSGRILDIPVGPSKWDPKRYSVMAHKGINFTYQGGAWDVMAEAVVLCEESGLGDAVDLLYHDEIYCDTDAAYDIRKIMETPPERLIYLAKRTPILRTDRKDLGRSWADPDDIKAA